LDGGFFGGLDVLVDERVGDRVELGEGGFVREDDLGQLGPVEGTVGGDDARAEGGGDLREPGGSGFDNDAGGLIGVEDDGPERRQSLLHRALARPDPACQPDPQHPRPLILSGRPPLALTARLLAYCSPCASGRYGSLTGCLLTASGCAMM
jgi:hypothetical protein